MMPKIKTSTTEIYIRLGSNKCKSIYTIRNLNPITDDEEAKLTIIHAVQVLDTLPTIEFKEGRCKSFNMTRTGVGTTYSQALDNLISNYEFYSLAKDCTSIEEAKDLWWKTKNKK